MADPAKKAPAVQTFENHARIVPGFHIVTFLILLLNFAYSVVRVIIDFSFENVVWLLLSVALVLLFFYARLFALTVQDRLIRLEMRLRLGYLLPPDLEPRIPDFTVAQLVALRFASDEELPELARIVLDKDIQDRKVIKKMVRNWQPDHLRV